MKVESEEVERLLKILGEFFEAQRKAQREQWREMMDELARLHAKLIHEYSVHLFESDIKVVLAKREREAREIKRWAKRNPQNRKHGRQLKRKVGGGFEVKP